jgi:predicted acyl esterase
MKMHLWVEADGSDDMDLFVYVSKLDEDGNELLPLVIDFPNPGVRGTLRVSHREVDENDPASFFDPFLTHRREQLLQPGEIVPVEFGIWPLGMRWHAGQQLRLIVQGFALPWMEDAAATGGSIFRWDLRNKGTHIIHTGGEYDSYLQVPRIPA